MDVDSSHVPNYTEGALLWGWIKGVVSSNKASNAVWRTVQVIDEFNLLPRNEDRTASPALIPEVWEPRDPLLMLRGSRRLWPWKSMKTPCSPQACLLQMRNRATGSTSWPVIFLKRARCWLVVRESLKSYNRALVNKTSCCRAPLCLQSPLPRPHCCCFVF